MRALLRGFLALLWVLALAANAQADARLEAARPAVASYVGNLISRAPRHRGQLALGTTARAHLVRLIANQQIPRGVLSALVRNRRVAGLLGRALSAVDALDGPTEHDSTRGLTDVVRRLARAKTGDEARAVVEFLETVTHEARRPSLAVYDSGLMAQGREPIVSPLSAELGADMVEAIGGRQIRFLGSGRLAEIALRGSDKYSSMAPRSVASRVRPWRVPSGRHLEHVRPATRDYINRLVARAPLTTQAVLGEGSQARNDLARLLGSQRVNWKQVSAMVRSAHASYHLPAILRELVRYAGEHQSDTVGGVGRIVRAVENASSTADVDAIAFFLAAAAEERVIAFGNAGGILLAQTGPTSVVATDFSPGAASPEVLAALGRLSKFRVRLYTRGSGAAWSAHKHVEARHHGFAPTADQHRALQDRLQRLNREGKRRARPKERYARPRTAKSSPLVRSAGSDRALSAEQRTGLLKSDIQQTGRLRLLVPEAAPSRSNKPARGPPRQLFFNWDEAAKKKSSKRRRGGGRR